MTLTQFYHWILAGKTKPANITPELWNARIKFLKLHPLDNVNLAPVQRRLK